MIIFAADLHCKQHVWKKLRTVKDDTFQTLKQLVEYANEEKAEAIVFGGDILDPPNSYTLKRYQEIMEKYDGPVYAISGQHDMSEPSWYSIPEIRAEDFHLRSVEISGFKFFGINWTPKNKLKTLLSEVPKDTDFLVMHQLVKALKSITYSWNLDESRIPEYIETLLIGDAHFPKEFEIPGGKGYYTGTPFPQSRSEIGRNGGFLLINNDKSVERITPKIRRIGEVEILCKSEVDKISEFVSVSDDKITPLLFVSYDPEINGILRSINNCIKDSEVIVSKRPLSSTREEISEYEGKKMEDLISEYTKKESLSFLLEKMVKSPSRDIIDQYFSKYWPNIDLGDQ